MIDSYPMINLQKKSPYKSINIPLNGILVGGIPTPLKNISSSVGTIIPNIWKVKKAMFQTTNQSFISDFIVDSPIKNCDFPWSFIRDLSLVIKISKATRWANESPGISSAVAPSGVVQDSSAMIGGFKQTVTTKNGQKWETGFEKISGWWYTYPSEKYEFVNGKDDIPYMKWTS